MWFDKTENAYASNMRGVDTGVAVGVTALFILGVLLLARIIFRDLLGWEQCYLVGDALIQYVHVIKMFLRHLMQGESLIYSFEAGMGMPTWALYAYYTLSPFNFIYLLIRDVDLATFLLVAGKLMTAGALFCLMLQRLVKPRRTISVILSVFYGLCGFSNYFFFGLLFLDMLYLMPVVMLAMERLIRTGHWRKLSIVYAVCFAMQFYCGYILGVFSAVVFMSMISYYSGKNRAYWLELTKKYLLCVLTAVLISAPITIPTAAELFVHLDHEVTKMPELSLRLCDFLAAFYPGYAGSAYNQAPVIYSGLLMFIPVGYFFFFKGSDKRKKLMLLIPLVFLLICTFVPGVYLMIHAFDVPDGYCYRFSWQYSFWLLYIAAIGSKEMSAAKNKKILLSLSGFMGSAYFVLWGLHQLKPLQGGIVYSRYTGVFSIAVLILYGISMYHLNKSKVWRVVLAGLCCVELLYNIGNIKQYYTKDSSNDREYSRIWQQQAEGAYSYVTKQEDNDPWRFYRLRNLNCLTDNISMSYGYHGLGYFLSVEPEKVRATLRDLGYATSGRQVLDYGSTAFTRMIFAQKYSLECGFWQGNQRGLYNVKKNANVLPLGFMVSEKLLMCELNSSNPFYNQNDLAEAMLGEMQIYPWKIFEGGVEIETNGLEMEPTDKGIKIRLVDAEAEGSAIWAFGNGEEKGNAYAYVPLWGMSGNVKDKVLVYSKKDIGGMLEYSKLTRPHIIPLDTGEDGRSEIYFKMLPGGEQEAEFETVCAAYEDEDAIQQIYSTLAKGGWNLTGFRDDEIKGTVQAEQGKSLLFTSVPYEKNWEAFVDGEKAETVPVLGEAFLAIRVPEGRHEVVIRYHNRLIIPAMVLSGCGILICLIAGYMKKQKSDINGVDMKTGE
ncbi:MAG: YfhO family protein [Lachnospiraceae bacterium]|nr:YfhO family protein [Lachnospiraceae bacterium]